MRPLLFSLFSCYTAARSIDLFHQLGPPLPFPYNTTGYYRGPSLITTSNGTLLAFIRGNFHRRDTTPNIMYLRRSFDDGNRWSQPVAILSDPNNRTQYGGMFVAFTTRTVLGHNKQVCILPPLSPHRGPCARPHYGRGAFDSHSRRRQTLLWM